MAVAALYVCERPAKRVGAFFFVLGLPSHIIYFSEKIYWISCIIYELGSDASRS